MFSIIYGPIDIDLNSYNIAFQIPDNKGRLIITRDIIAYRTTV
ncbi:hypothetical protein D088_240001 [Salmonella enterica subsp. houtenae serovar 16:z4,z32:-- str. RKS3027]|nr:hypothetical protein D088_240001 [Salmonella enterica subsp. houtenae serovar 16:z4,z32:-- str. RKS3027]